MGVRECGAGRRRTTWGETATSLSKTYRVLWWIATRMVMTAASGAGRAERGTQT